MSETTTEIATIVDSPAPVAGLASELANLSSGRITGYSSITGTDFASRKAVIKAMTSATPVADILGKTINLKDVVIQEVSLVNERTGELQAVPRITLIDADGSAYSATSDVLYKDVKTFFTILGTPNHWPEPVAVVVNKEKAKGAGHYFSLSFADDVAAKK